MDPRFSTSYAANAAMGIPQADQVHAGLRAHFLRIYRYMAVALGLTAVGIYGLMQTSLPMLLAGNLVGALILAFVPLGVFMYVGRRFDSMSFGAMVVAFAIFAFSMALPTALLTQFASATGQDMAIARAFLATAVTFGATSLIGYTTKRDLSGMAGFLCVGCLGVFVVSLLNIFIFQSSFLMIALSIVIVLIFAGLIMWETQALKTQYLEVGVYQGEAVQQKLALMGAMNLYFDVIAIFRQLLFLFLSFSNND